MGARRGTEAVRNVGWVGLAENRGPGPGPWSWMFIESRLSWPRPTQLEFNTVGVCATPRRALPPPSTTSSRSGPLEFGLLDALCSQPAASTYLRTGPPRSVVHHQHTRDFQQEQAVAGSCHRYQASLAWEGWFRFEMPLNERDTAQLRAALQGAVVKCSERCLYQSAKWYATHCELC